MRVRQLVVLCAMATLPLAPWAAMAGPVPVLVAHGEFGSLTNAGSDAHNPDATALQDGNLQTIDTNLDLYSAGCGLGYDFGGIGQISSFLLQQSSAGARITRLRIYYSGGQQDIAVGPSRCILPQTITTSFLYIRPLDVLVGASDSAGITEFTVSPASLDARTNVLAGLAASRITKLGWQNINGNTSDTVLVDGKMAFDGLAANVNPATVWLPTAPNGQGSDNYLQFDLGSAQMVSTLGLSQQLGTRETSTDRRELCTVRLMLADDATFSQGVTSYDFTMDPEQGYGQFDFSPTTARYVRLSALTRQSQGNACPGLTEVELYAPIATKIVALKGDANMDERVDFNDYLVLEANFGLTGDPGHGDFNGDGMIDFNDYLTLEANFGLATTVPEPATCTILLAGLGIIRRFCR